MIRINLLGAPKAKKAKRAALSMGGGGSNSLIAILIVLAVGVGGNALYYMKLNREATKIQTDLDAARQENRALAQVKSSYQERQKQFELYDRRVKVIHQLQANQSGPSELLNTVASTVNQTDAVWLQTMNDDGKNINLAGTALSANAVANLITNLKKTNYFRNVEIKETYQDEQFRDMQAYQFKLVCEKQKS